MITDFGKWIKQKRKKKNMSITEVSAASRISIAQISRIETGARGVPRPDTIKGLAFALEVDYEELMVRAGHLESVRK